MKYVRTKDGIFDLSRFKFEKGDIDQSKVGSRQDCYLEQHDIEYCRHRCIWAKDIIKQADTIEKLCDGFIIGETLKIYNKSNFDFEKKRVNLGQKCWVKFENIKSIYGVVMVFYGDIPRIITVAKINDKGELELL